MTSYFTLKKKNLLTVDDRLNFAWVWPSMKVHLSPVLKVLKLFFFFNQILSELCNHFILFRFVSFLYINTDTFQNFQLIWWINWTKIKAFCRKQNKLFSLTNVGCLRPIQITILKSFKKSISNLFTYIFWRIVLDLQLKNSSVFSAG